MKSYLIGLAIIATIPACALLCAYIAHDQGESYLCSSLVFVAYAYAHYKALDKVINIYNNRKK